MTPKEKAIELYNKFFTNVPFLTAGCHPLDDYNAAKQCALIAVDEIINEIYNIDHQHSAIYDEVNTFYTYNDCKELTFWKNVKQEIEAL